MYNIMKKIIQTKNYNKNDVMNKLDIFLAKDRITSEQYEELVNMMNKTN